MSDDATIQVNFGRPMPVFPLNTVVLLPHVPLHLHIFEERYRRMVHDALDGAGQIALAVFEGSAWHEEYHGRPPVRAAVCVGQMVEHFKYPDGRYNLTVQGVGRAKIVHELPASEERPYRAAMLEPVGAYPVDESVLDADRERLASMLVQPPLSDLREAVSVLAHLADEDIPTSAILELTTLSFLNYTETRYGVLAEGEPGARGRRVLAELSRLRRLLSRAAPQRAVECPRGCSWN